MFSFHSCTSSRHQHLAFWCAAAGNFAHQLQAVGCGIRAGLAAVFTLVRRAVAHRFATIFTVSRCPFLTYAATQITRCKYAWLSYYRPVVAIARPNIVVFAYSYRPVSAVIIVTWVGIYSVQNLALEVENRQFSPVVASVGGCHVSSLSNFCGTSVFLAS